MFGIRRRLNNKRVLKEIQVVRDEASVLLKKLEDGNITRKDFLDMQSILGAKIKKLERELV